MPSPLALTDLVYLIGLYNTITDSFTINIQARCT